METVRKNSKAAEVWALGRTSAASLARHIKHGEIQTVGFVEASTQPTVIVDALRFQGLGYLLADSTFVRVVNGQLYGLHWNDISAVRSDGVVTDGELWSLNFAQAIATKKISRNFDFWSISGGSTSFAYGFVRHGALWSLGSASVVASKAISLHGALHVAGFLDLASLKRSRADLEIVSIDHIEGSSFKTALGDLAFEGVGYGLGIISQGAPVPVRIWISMLGDRTSIVLLDHKHSVDVLEERIRFRSDDAITRKV